MKILGINQVPGIIASMHDSAAAIVVDGKIIATAEEERFNRVRHSRGYPKRAIEYCLQEAELSLADIDIIAIANNPYAQLRRLRVNLYPSNFLRYLVNLAIFEHYRMTIRRQTSAKIVFVDHHAAHAASAYYCSGHDEVNVLTIDGSGETESCAFYEGKGGKLHKGWDIPLSSVFEKKKWHSIGGVYSAVTNLLGMGVHGEGKTMGLASYGEPRYDFSTILNITNHHKYRIDRRPVLTQFAKFKRSTSDEPLTKDHEDIAASLQTALEESIVNLTREIYASNKIRNFAFAGGVALNCNTNTRVLLEDFCNDLFVQPAANDGGLGLGAALYQAGVVGEAKNERLHHAYWGPSFSNEEIEALLKNAKVKYAYHEDIEAQTAALLTEGKIVSWFQGRMEIGPRALGNRSILGDPTIPGMNDKINEFVKHREKWRPFAPSVAQEAAPTYFEGVDKTGISPFMLHTFYVKEQFRSKLPSITHVDGSSRIQTVREDQNKRYYTLLKEMEQRNGFPIVLNTSFNDAGEPIVCTPKDAVKCYFATGIDHLVIGNYIVSK